MLKGNRCRTKQLNEEVSELLFAESTLARGRLRESNSPEYIMHSAKRQVEWSRNHRAPCSHFCENWKDNRMSLLKVRPLCLGAFKIRGIGTLDYLTKSTLTDTAEMETV